MLEIEKVMRNSLCNLTKQSTKDYLNCKRTDWVAKWPGQVILAVDQIHWTTETEQAIKEYAQGGLDEYKLKLQD